MKTSKDLVNKRRDLIMKEIQIKKTVDVDELAEKFPFLKSLYAVIYNIGKIKAQLKNITEEPGLSKTLLKMIKIITRLINTQLPNMQLHL